MPINNNKEYNPLTETTNTGVSEEKNSIIHFLDNLVRKIFNATLDFFNPQKGFFGYVFEAKPPQPTTESDNLKEDLEKASLKMVGNLNLTSSRGSLKRKSEILSAEQSTKRPRSTDLSGLQIQKTAIEPSLDKQCELRILDSLSEITQSEENYIKDLRLLTDKKTWEPQIKKQTFFESFYSKIISKKIPESPKQTFYEYLYSKEIISKNELNSLTSFAEKAKTLSEKLLLQLPSKDPLQDRRDKIRIEILKIKNGILLSDKTQKVRDQEVDKLEKELSELIKKEKTRDTSTVPQNLSTVIKVFSPENEAFNLVGRNLHQASNDYLAILNIINKAKIKNENLFDQFENNNIDQLNIESVLIKPMQRLAKYGTIFQAMIEATTTSPDLNEKLKACLANIKSFK